jgi:hypothetical protein
MPPCASRNRKPTVEYRYAPILIAAQPDPPEPIRGVRLKAVSAFVMIFAVLCTLAFIAGYTTR